MLVGLNPANATPGNVARAALMATAFNLRMGCEILTGQGFPLKQIVLTGGLARTPALGQVIADIFRLPVIVPEGGNEGSAWGAALLAKYRTECAKGETSAWEVFLEKHDSGKGLQFSPNADAAANCDRAFRRYKRLLEVHPGLDAAVNGMEG